MVASPEGLFTAELNSPAELATFDERLAHAPPSVALPSEPTGPFGACVDQFGISWMVNISQPQA